MIHTYGAIDSKGCLIDTAISLHGAKCHATRNGYKKIGLRHGYNVVKVWQKENNKWAEL